MIDCEQYDFKRNNETTKRIQCVRVLSPSFDAVVLRIDQDMIELID